jgi:purine-binding chemotaxis protein CheW
MAETASPHAAQEARRFLVFRMDRRLYALPSEDVVEVIRTPAVARVPQAPKALIGIANLRGNVLPLTSLHGLLGLEERESDRSIVLDGVQSAALAVDSVEALVTVAPDRVETQQSELAAEPGELITGAFQVDRLGVVKILDVKAMLEKVFAQRATHKKVGGSARRAMHADETIAAAETDILVTFDVAGQEYALPLATVQEIIPAPEVATPMPRAETLVVGMMAYRDSLLPLLSLRGLLGFVPAKDFDSRQKVLVTTVRGVLIGLVADNARAIVAADRSLIDPIPNVLTVRSGGETRIKAIYRGDNGARLISILSPEQLFREDVMQRLGSEKSPIQKANVQSDSGERQFLVFRLGDDEFGLPIEAVDEVAQVPEKVARVPKTPKFLDGVVNLRGEVLPVVDQRRRFDMPEITQKEGRRLVVVRTEGHRAGLIVDSVSEVLRSSTNSVEPPPDLTGEITRLVHGVINLEAQGRIILLLDPAELLTRTEHGQLDAFESKAKA